MTRTRGLAVAPMIEIEHVGNDIVVHRPGTGDVFYRIAVDQVPDGERNPTAYVLEQAALHYTALADAFEQIARETRK
jgi:hypothetical protein